MLIESLAKSILGKLASFSVELASKYVVEEIKAAKSAKKDLKIIADKIEAICAVLEDAEEKGYSNKRIKVWLRDLKRVLYDIDDLLDEVAYDAKLRKVNEGRFCRQLRYYASSSNPIISRFSLSHKIKHLREKLDNVVAKKNDFGLDERRTDHSLRDEIRDPLDRCPFVHKPTIFGRDEAKQYILGEVYGVGDATELSVLPIMGMGGIGKTTLAKLVYNDVQCFDLKLWACVSDKFQIRQIIEDIVKSGKGDVAPNQDLNTLVEKLQDLLKDQKYFLVLDDVWENDVVKWKKLKDLLMIGRAGSVILITTRDPNVASITKTRNLKPYNLQKLPEDVCWSIFKGLAFTDEDEEARCPRLYKIGESIIKKCCGIPLVVITLGSLLRRERDDKKWQKINEMDSFVQLDQHYEKVIQILKLSYDKLSSKLKSCFALLSLYPKDSILYAATIYIWSALGLLQVRNDQNNDIESYGYSCLMDLVSRSLLDEDPLYHIDKLYCECKMHDILHDLALNFLQEDLSVVTLEKLAVTELTMHIVWGYEEGDQLKDTKFPIELHHNTKNARTFRFSYKMHHLSQSFLEGIISHFSCLRILELGNGWFEKLPESIGKLKHLRYLNLSYNPILRSLPNTICELLNLEYLNFMGCKQLKEIPKDVFQLQSLRYLGVTTCEMSLVDTKLNKLTSLHTLVVESCKRLESLWESGDVGGLTSLRKLYITDCPKLKCLPNSMKFLVSLQQLMIENCEELEMEEGEGLQGLQSLRLLQIKGVPKMKNIPDGIQSAAASLEYLIIDNCEGLVQLPEWLQHFASLRVIEINDCPNLLSLPTGFRHLQSLQKLWIDKCPHLSEKCAEYEGEDYPLIKHNYIYSLTVSSSKERKSQLMNEPAGFVEGDIEVDKPNMDDFE